MFIDILIILAATYLFTYAIKAYQLTLFYYERWGFIKYNVEKVRRGHTNHLSLLIFYLYVVDVLLVFFMHPLMLARYKINGLFHEVNEQQKIKKAWRISLDICEMVDPKNME